MGSYYSIIRYMPDVNTGECLNAGVLVFGDDRVRVRFVRDWGRIRRFGDGNISFLRQFARDVEDAAESPHVSDRLTPDKVKSMASTWIHCIRLTPPSYAMLDVDRLLEFAAEKFLPLPRQPKPKPRSRRGAIKVAADALKDALRSRGGDEALSHLGRREQIHGKRISHIFPLVMRNGSPKLAVEAFSFEIVKGEEIKRDIKATAFAIRDIRETSPDIGSAIVMLEPAFEFGLYHDAVATFEEQGSKVVTEFEVEEWAEDAAKLVLH